VHCVEVVVRLVGSRCGVRFGGQLEQWVWFARALFGDESSRFVKRLHEELFIGG
jgi:hypothetical protein